MAKNSVTRNSRGTIFTGGYGSPGYIGGSWGMKAAKSGSPVNRRSMPAPTGEAVVGNRLNKVAAGLKKIGPAFRAVTPKQQVVSNVVRERTSPAPSRPAAPARMATNPVTGKTTGFTSGTTTGKTMTKAGVASKTAESAYQRQQRMAKEKMGVAGPRGGASKASSSGTRSTGGGMRSSGGGAVGSTSGTRGYSSGGNVGRGDVGAGRRGGGR